MKLENSMQKLLVSSILLTGKTLANNSFGLGSSGPTSRHFQDSLPHCGKPRYHHNVNLFFELPSERKRREEGLSPANFTSGERHYGNRDWLASSAKQIKKMKRKEERLAAKGKVAKNDHLNSQRLIGGQTAIPHSWPWQVFVKIEGKSGGYDCGGSIIGKRWIVTAAHCVPYRPVASMSYVYAGIHHIHTGEKKKLKVKRVIVHEKYGYPILDNNDIALVELANDLVFSENIQPICLPDPSICLPHGMKCAATGWGVTDKFGTQIPDQLNEVAVRIIETQYCENIHSDYSGQLSEQMICAGYKEGGRDACLGDSGGPLACQVDDNGPWLLYGITSWGIGCGDPLHPGVYTRVTELMAWIEDHTGIGPAISGGDFPKHQCSNQPLATPLIQKPSNNPQTPSPSHLTSRKEEETQAKKPSKQTQTEVTPTGDFDLQAVIDADLKEVKSCGGSTDLKAGSLKSPGYGKKYPVGIKCLWQIQPNIPDDQWLEIEFKKNEFGKCTDKGFRYSLKPKNDYIAILNKDNKVINRSICRASNNTPLYIYSQKSASIFMSSDGSASDNGKGFRMRFKTLDYVPSRCGGERVQRLASDETIQISSANFPNRYLSGINCEWEIIAPLGHVLVINVNQHDIDGPVNGQCTKSYTLFTESSSGNELGRLCGKVSKKNLAKKKMESSTNSIKVVFEAGNSPPRRGFRFSIRAVPQDLDKEVRALASESDIDTRLSDMSTDALVTRFERIWDVLKLRLGITEAI